MAKEKSKGRKEVKKAKTKDPKKSKAPKVQQAA